MGYLEYLVSKVKRVHPDILGHLDFQALKVIEDLMDCRVFLVFPVSIISLNVICVSFVKTLFIKGIKGQTGPKGLNLYFRDILNE